MAVDHSLVVRQYIDEHEDDAVGLFQQLVRTISANPPGDEKAVADICAAYGADLGMEVAQHEPAPRRVSNLMRLPGLGGGPTLLFNSHLDTFPAGDEGNWRHPPYAAEIHDGVVWGVGTRNMKAGVAAAMFTARAVTACGVPLRGDLLLCQAADEIVLGDLGLRWLVERGLVKADMAVYTEANPPLKIEIAARGMVRLEVTVRGLAKHTKYKVEPSTSGQPINAIAKMAPVIAAIEAMTFTGWEPNAHIPGPPVISVNQISGGQHPAQTAESCIILCDCRTLPGQRTDDVLADVQRVVDACRAADPELRAEVRVVTEAESCGIAPDAPIVAAVQRAVVSVIGHEIPVAGVGSTSDMRWLVNVAGIPTCKFMFPSTETGTNEFETVEDYMNTIRVYAALILDQLL